MAAPLASVSPAKDRRSIASREDLVRRVCGEFTEMPCLRLTCEQAQRLFSLRRDVCERLLATLVQQGTLTYSRDGRYRLNDTLWPGKTMLVQQRAVYPPKAS
jgi:hypothetical protein